MKVSFYPAFDDPDSLTDHFHRLHWYLHPLRERISEIVLPRLSDDIAPGATPDYLDPEIESLIGGLPVSFATVADEQALQKTADRAETVFLWKSAANAPNAIPPALHGKRVIRVDHARVRAAGSFYLMFAELFDDLQADYLTQSRHIFDRVAARCKSKIGYIFGTGPGLAEASDHDFTDGVSIACNSMVRNHELLDRLQPPLIVVADPIFHAGPSRYAAAFRKELIGALDRYKSDLIVPMRDLHIYRACLPDRFAGRIAGMPFKAGEEPNFDLDKDYFVTSKPNVLTLFLLPLASTFFEQIRIFGCDGRPMVENSYFWGHDKASQFNDEMEGIKRAHPAFFEIDFDDYYYTHCKTLAHWLEAAEERGKSVSNHTPSYIPALYSRNTEGVRRLEEPEIKRTYDELVSIDPDALGHFGHYLAFDARLGEAAQKHDLKFQVWGSNRAEDLPDLAFSFERIFSDHSWTIANRKGGPTKEHLERFDAEFRSALKGIDVSADRRIMLFFYCGSLHHAEIILNALSEHHHIDCNVNLFYATFEDYQSAAFRKRWTPFLERVFRSDRLSITAPTPQFQNNFYQTTSFLLPVAPHPSTTFSDDDAAALIARAAPVETRKTRVLFPGGVLKDKGFDLTAGCIECLSGASEVECVAFARAARKHPPQMQEALDNIISAGAEVNDQIMDGDEFVRFLDSADVIVLPYRAPAFSERTSGLLIDAMLLGIPSVVLEDTWLGDVARETGCGVAVADNADALAEGVQEILNNLDAYKARTQQARKDYPRDNSWSALVDVILTPALNTRPAAASFDTTAITPASKIRGLLEYDRQDRAHIDETEAVSRLLSARKGKRHILVDVGAHTGSSSSYFHKLGWTIHCFEPDAANRKALEKRFHRKRNVTIDERAVSDEARQGVAFFSSDVSTGISGLHAFHDTHAQTATVDVTTLANIAAERKLDHIDFLKIDVEGFDLSVLKGVPWDRIKPDVIECEFEDAKTERLGHNWRDIADYLKHLGYAVYISEWHPIVSYGMRHDWRRILPYPSIDLDRAAWGNLLAFKEDPGYAAVKTAFESLVETRQDDDAQGKGAAPTPIAPPSRAATVKRIAKGGLGGLWRRRIWTAPAMALLTLIVLAGFAPGLEAYRLPLLGLASLGVLAFCILYLGLRSYQHFSALAIETRNLRAELVRATKAHKKEMENQAAELRRLRSKLSETANLAGALEAAHETFSEKTRSEFADIETRLEKSGIDEKATCVTQLRERIAAGERQIGLLRYPKAPSCLVLFGHHKCGSRFFRTQIFTQAAAMTDARLRSYDVKTPPFHYSEMDDLDLCNIDFDRLGIEGRDVVMFANATERSLAAIKNASTDWKGVRVLRDPRQVLISNYFHHKGNHHTELNGWVWDQLKHDQPILRTLSEEEGLLYELDNISKQVIEKQVLAPFADDRVMTIKIEEFSENPRDWLRRLSEFLEIPDIAGINHGRTSANRDSGPWRAHFTPKLKDVFKERYGQALIELGYADDLDW